MKGWGGKECVEGKEGEKKKNDEKQRMREDGQSLSLQLRLLIW